MSAKFVKDCGDSTSIYDCTMLKDDVTVKEFWEAVKDSCDGKDEDGKVFNEWWATFDISFEGKPWLERIVDLDYMGDGKIHRDAWSHTTEEDITVKYGDRIVTGCRWNGGWGRGGYSLKIKFDPVKDEVKDV